jgi:hypothetical protein
MQAFTPAEVARLDAWTTQGQSPGQQLQERLVQRMEEPFLKEVCPE